MHMLICIRPMDGKGWVRPNSTIRMDGDNMDIDLHSGCGLGRGSICVRINFWLVIRVSVRGKGWVAFYPLDSFCPSPLGIHSIDYSP